jgi:hypothetical protein
VRWPESAPDFRNLGIDERSRGVLRFDEGRAATWRQIGEDHGMTSAVAGDATCLLYFFRWHPGRNSALLANAHRPDVCLPASGWKQTGDLGVRQYQITPDLVVPFRHFEFGYNASGHVRYAHAFYCVWEDRVRSAGQNEASSMSGSPSEWSRSERIQAVLAGRRHLGQQVMEYLLIAPREVGETVAEQDFAGKVRQLINPGARTDLAQK